MLRGQAVDVRPDGGRADEGDRSDVRVGAERVDRTFAAMDDVQHAGRHAGLKRKFGQQHGRQGSCSEGLSTNVLPQTMAIGNIHSGIIAGKLKGVMPAHTPMGWRKV